MGEGTNGNGDGRHYSYTEALSKISELSGIPVSGVRRVVEAVMDVATESLLSDRAHFNLGRFGTFEIKDVAPARVRNPRAKAGDPDEFYDAPARKKVRFREGSTFAAEIKEHFQIGDSVVSTGPTATSA